MARLPFGRWAGGGEGIYDGASGQPPARTIDPPTLGAPREDPSERLYAYSPPPESWVLLTNPFFRPSSRVPSNVSKNSA